MSDRFRPHVRPYRHLFAVFAAAIMLGLALPAPAQSNNRGLPDFTDLVEKAGPAVVNIRTTELVRNGAGAIPGLDENDPLFEFFRRFLPPGQTLPKRSSPSDRDEDGSDEIPRGVGSGFVITSDGYVLTNAHVVRGASTVYITLPDKREFKAQVIGADARTDVAVLKIEATGLPHVAIGSVDDVKPGQWVLAIGSPFGLENTVTAGIVSAKGRETGEYLPFIQTDVAVNPGNSGGPLLNLKGEVIGINSQIYSRTGGFMGISFAIPIDEAMRVADQLRTTGHVTRGRIGVAIEEVSKEVADGLGIKAAGAMVRTVERDSPAAKAGVEPGDIILRWQGRPIDKQSDLPRAVGNTKPGTQASLQVWRRGHLHELPIVVGEAVPDQADARPSASGGERNRAPAPTNVLGLSVSDLSAARKAELQVRNGVQIESAEGVAARAGLRAGDVILAVDNVEVASAKHFNEMVAKADRSRGAVLLVRRGEQAQFVPLKPNAR